VQVLYPEVVLQLRDWITTKKFLEPEMLLFPVSGRMLGGTPRKTTSMIKCDLAAARKKWLEEAEAEEELQRRMKLDFLCHCNHDGLYADFHSLRHIHSRRVHLAGITTKPDGMWMVQQACNMSMFFAEQGERQPTHIIRDRDAKFTREFCAILESDGIKFTPIPSRSPNLNPHAETWVQRVKRECLDWFIVFGERHLRYILNCWLDFYNNYRPHQGLGNVPIGDPPPDLKPVDHFRLEDTVCHEFLGGLIKHYVWKAA